MLFFEPNNLANCDRRQVKVGHPEIIVTRGRYNSLLMGGPLIGFIQAVGAGNWDAATIYLGVAVVVLLICFPFHELAHAVAADRLGDDTPRMAGRLTLNPAAHLSLTGSAMFLLFGFGWATTPVNPSKLRGQQHISHALVAVAGPAANLVMAVIIGLGIRAAFASGADAAATPAARIFTQTAILAVSFNVLLCFFNLLPVPPLDGWTILRGLLPYRWQAALSAVERYQTYIFLLLFVLGGSILGPLILRPAQDLTRAIIGF